MPKLSSLLLLTLGRIFLPCSGGVFLITNAMVQTIMSGDLLKKQGSRGEYSFDLRSSGQHQELMVSDGQVWRKEVNTNFTVVYRVGLALCWVTLGLALGVTNWMSIILSLVSSFAANCLINSSQILSFSSQIKRLYSLVLVWLLKVTFLVKKLNLFTNMLLISGSQWLFDQGCALQISQNFLL